MGHGGHNHARRMQTGKTKWTTWLTKNGMPIGEVLGLQKDLEFEVGKSNKDARAIQEQRNQRRNKKQGTRFSEQKEEKRKAA